MNNIYTSWRVEPTKGKYFPTLIVESNKEDCSGCGSTIDLHKAGFKTMEKAIQYAKGFAIFHGCNFQSAI